MSARLNMIRDACQLEPEKRTEEDVTAVLEFVKDEKNKFFQRLSIVQQRTLCKTMTLEIFEAKEFVFKAGDIGSKFYIILSGMVSVQVPAGPPTDDCLNRNFDTVVFLEKGMSFGESGLQSDQPRSASIYCTERTELLVIKRSDYEKYVGQLHKQFIERRVKFLRQCPSIEDALQKMLVTSQDIAQMANCLNEQSLSGNAVACRQGEIVDHMIFVRSGSLAMIREVDPDAVREAQKAAAGKSRSSSQRTSANNKDMDDIAPVKAKSPVQKEQTHLELAQNLAKAMRDFKGGGEVPVKPREEAVEKAAPAPSLATMTSMTSRSFSNVGKEEKRRAFGKGWSKLKLAFKLATGVNRFTKIEEKSGLVEESEVQAAEKNVEHFRTVQKMRMQYTKFQFKKMETMVSKRKSIKKDSVRYRPDLKKADGSVPKRKRCLLRIGTIGPYQYFGDQQVINTAVYPVSLLSDPIAEIYIMSRQDIQRRLPKKLFPTLFPTECESVPSDAELLEMHRQTQRWNAFRRSMHAEALSNRSSSMVCGIPRPLRDSSNVRADAMAKLEFLGIATASELAESIWPVPPNRTVALTRKDEEFFSQASADFLRRMEEMKRDKGLRNALAQAGVRRGGRLDVLSLDDDEPDPMKCRFEQHWSKLRKDPINLDLDDALVDEATKAVTAADFPPASSSSSWRKSVPGKGGRRVSILETKGTGNLDSPELAPDLPAFDFVGGASESFSIPKPPSERPSVTGARVGDAVSSLRRRSFKPGPQPTGTGSLLEHGDERSSSTWVKSASTISSKAPGSTRHVAFQKST